MESATGAIAKGNAHLQQGKESRDVLVSYCDGVIPGRGRDRNHREGVVPQRPA
jgi:hypothetical protein